MGHQTEIATGSAADPLLEVDRLVIDYRTEAGEVSAVADVSFTVASGESLGLVGESGSGKTSLALSLLQLLPDNGHIASGDIRIEGESYVGLPEKELRRRRWRDVSMVSQGAMNAWNPVHTVGDQIREALRLHWPTRLSHREETDRITLLFEMVGLTPTMIDRYPHEFSGGMRQRALIAMALSCNPSLIVADEPTTALDVIVQHQILRELEAVQHRLGMSIVYISHDIAVIAEVTDRIGVMYAGKLVELGATADVFARPRHPYTFGLLNATPSVSGPRRSLTPLVGEPPDMLDPPPGCRFHPRCPFATERCGTEEPPMADIGGGRTVACWHWEEVPEIGELAR